MINKSRSPILAFVLIGASLVWASRAAAAPPTPAAKPLAYLQKSVGVECYGLWKTQPLSTRMKALLGPQQYAAFIHNMDPCGELTLTNGVLSTTGNAPHMGGEEEGILLVDTEKDVIEILILHGGKTVQAWTEKHTALALPAPVSQTLEHWPQPALKSALAKLSPAGP